MAEKKVMKLASRGKRFGAFCIDFIVPFFVYLVFFGILSAAGINPYNQGYNYGFGYGYGFGYDLGYNYGSRLSGASAAIMIVLFLVLLAYIVVECIFFAKGKSVGKAIVGLQVVSSHDGKPFGFWKMMLRECIVKQASGVMLLGYIWVLIDEKNRARHDKILDSYVVDLKESEKMNLKRNLQNAEEMAYKAHRAAIQQTAAAEEPKDEAAEIAAESPSEEPVVAEAIENTKPETPDIETEVEAAPEVSMAMKKAELIEAAQKAGIKVRSKATKEEIIEAIRNNRDNEEDRQDRTE